VELAIVSSLLLVLIFGIITYAYMMSFRQSMTQAAAEGARAAALAPATPATEAQTRGQAALNGALGGFDESCTGGGLTCDIVKAACAADPSRQCVTVSLDYDYAAFPLLPALPLLSGILPDSLSAESVVEIDQ